MRRPSFLRARRTSTGAADAEAYLEAYRALLSRQLDVGRFEQALEELKSLNDPAIAISKRNDLAYVYLHFARLLRGEVESTGEIEGIGRILFLPLDHDDRIGFVSHRKLADCAPRDGKGLQPAFEVLALEPQQVGWRPIGGGATIPGALGEAFRLETVDAEARIPGLLAVLARTSGKPAGTLLVVEQTVPDTPHCLIVLTPAEGATARFDEQDERDLSALVRIFFQTYLSMRQRSFTRAYRRLVNEGLVLPAQQGAIEAARARIDAMGQATVPPFAQFLCFFCDSLSQAGVLPEMDNALFFPLSSRLYYLYHNGPPIEALAARQRPLARLRVGALGIEEPRRRDELGRIRDHLAAPALTAGRGPEETRSIELFGDALDLLCASTALDAAAVELERLLVRVHDRIDRFLEVLGQAPRSSELPVITAVEAALFPTVRWCDLELELLDRDFLTYSGAPSSGGGSTFPSTGSLLVLTICVDHLPLGILFLNSALPGAFGEEDRSDVQAIARGYFQNFQNRMLLDVVSEYQALGNTLTLSALENEEMRARQDRESQEQGEGEAAASSGPSNRREAGRRLGSYFDRLFAAFEDLDVGAFFAVDRDELFVYRRAANQKVEGRHTRLRAAIERLGSAVVNELNSNLDRDLERMSAAVCRRSAASDAPLGAEADVAEQARDRLRWFYRWTLLRSLEPDHLAAAGHPLSGIPAEIFCAAWPTGPQQDPQVRSLLVDACFEATVFEQDFPCLRELVRALTGAELLRSRTGSVIALALFYDALPVGLILLCSASFLALTERIEAPDARMATRAFLLPAQMESREEVVRAYQRILGEGSGHHGDYLALVGDFMRTMAESLPTMRAGLFLALDRDVLMSLTSDGDGRFATARWKPRDLAEFGAPAPGACSELETLIVATEEERRDLDAARRAGTRALAALCDNDLRLFYLRRLRDLFKGSREPRELDLGALVEEAFALSGATAGGRQPAAKSALRSHVHVLAEPSCVFRRALPCLDRLFILDGADTRRARSIHEIYEQHWQGSGALLLQEGLPLGIVLLASPFEGSFTDHERIDVACGARSYFAEGQVQLRDQIIDAYRGIVSNLLSEEGTRAHIKELQARNDRLRAQLEDDEAAAHLAVFMDVMFKAFASDPPETVAFLPFTGQFVYRGLPVVQPGGPALERLEKMRCSDIVQGLPPGSSWESFTEDWLGDLYRDILGRRTTDVPAPPRTVTAILEKLRSDPSGLVSDTALASFLFSGQRYADPLETSHRHAYAAPFARILAPHGAGDEAGSLIMTAVLYDYLPTVGIVVISSSTPWRFTAQDRVDVESVARAFFLTYRSVRLHAAAASTERVKGMQDMLLGVTHRLKNDLDPTLGVIDVLRRVDKNNPEEVYREVRQLADLGFIAAGSLGIAQVKNRFELLRSVITNSAHLHKARRLSDLARRFQELVANYKTSVPLRQPRYRTYPVRLCVNELDADLLGCLDASPEQVIGDLHETWVDVSDGLDEVLAIYAENTVKAVADPATSDNTIYLWILENERPELIDLVIYDRVVIPAGKLAYIERGEVIPMEVGGGSGTGLYNARNLLALNDDGNQRVQSSAALAGAAIWLTIRRLRITPVIVTTARLIEDMNRWRASLHAIAGGEEIEWCAPVAHASNARVTLYEGTYLWSEELFPIIFQVFLQRHQFLRDRDKHPDPYKVSTVLSAAPGGGLLLEVFDNTHDPFAPAYVSEGERLEILERVHNGQSRLGPRRGAVGSWLLAMRNRLEAQDLGIEIAPGTDAAGLGITVKFRPTP